MQQVEDRGRGCVIATLPRGKSARFLRVTPSSLSQGFTKRQSLR